MSSDLNLTEDSGDIQAKVLDNTTQKVLTSESKDDDEVPNLLELLGSLRSDTQELQSRAREQDISQLSLRNELVQLKAGSQEILTLLQQLLGKSEPSEAVPPPAEAQKVTSQDAQAQVKVENTDPSLSRMVREFRETVDEAIGAFPQEDLNSEQTSPDSVLAEDVARRDAEAFARHRLRQVSARDGALDSAEQGFIQGNKVQHSAQAAADIGRTFFLKELVAASEASRVVPPATSVAGISGIAAAQSLHQLQGAEFADPLRVADPLSQAEARALRSSVGDHFQNARTLQAETLARSNAYDAQLSKAGQPSVSRMDSSGRAIIDTLTSVERASEQRASQFQASRAVDTSRSVGTIAFGVNFVVRDMQGGRKISMDDMNLYSLGQFADQVYMYIVDPSNQPLQLWSFLDRMVKSYIINKRQILSFQPSMLIMYGLPAVRPMLTERDMKILGPREILNEMFHSLTPTDMTEYEDMLRKALQAYDREHFAQWQRDKASTLTWGMLQKERITFTLGVLETLGEVDRSTGKLQCNYPGTKPVKHLGLEGLLDIFFDSKSWTSRMKRVFLLRLGRSPLDVMFSAFLGRLMALIELLISTNVHTYLLLNSFESRHAAADSSRDAAVDVRGRSEDSRRRQRLNDDHSKLSQPGAVTRSGAKRIRTFLSGSERRAAGRNVSSRPRTIHVLDEDSHSNASTGSSKQEQDSSESDDNVSTGSSEQQSISDTSGDAQLHDSEVLGKLLQNLSAASINAIAGLPADMKNKILIRKEREDSRYRAAAKGSSAEDVSQKPCTAFMHGSCTYEKCKYSHDPDICLAAFDKISQNMAILRAKRGSSGRSPVITAISTRRFDKDADSSVRPKQDRSHGSRGKDRPQGARSKSLSSIAGRDHGSRSDGSVGSD